VRPPGIDLEPVSRDDPRSSFHALFDKVCRRDVLQRARVTVRNNGASGVDRIMLAQAREYGVDRLLGEVVEELRQRRRPPLPARRVLIPKPGLKDQYRPLPIPAVCDRIVQATLKIVLEQNPPMQKITSGWPSSGATSSLEPQFATQLATRLEVDVGTSIAPRS
jgi:retron-type reverse transcriptase